MRTQVAIIGAGPAGLFLSHLLEQAAIDCVVTGGNTKARPGVLGFGSAKPNLPPRRRVHNLVRRRRPESTPRQSRLQPFTGSAKSG